jgi:excisionase family DNA binding protein
VEIDAFEVAAMYGVSPRTLRRMIERGEVPPPVTPPGRSRRWNKAQIEHAIARRAKR